MQPPRPRFRSLRADLLIAAVVPLIILGIGAAVTNYSVSRIQRTGRLESKLETVASFLIDASELGLLTESSEVLREPVLRALADEDVVHVSVYNSRGVVLLSEGQEIADLSRRDLIAANLGPQFRPTGPKLHELRRAVRFAVEDQGAELGGFLENREVGEPDGELQGYVRIVISGERVAAEFHDLLLWSGASMAVVVVLGVVLALALSRESIRGMSLLSTAVRHVGRGQLDVLVPEVGSGEVAEAARAFNEMSAQLREARDEISEHQIQLERKVEERTRELNLMRIEAERASVAKSHFLANMSHEIRTPMTAILGFVDALLERPRDEEQRRNFLGVIKRNGTHLLEILNTILDLSKLEAGRMEIEEIECSPVETAEEVAGLLRGRAREKNLAFELECQPEVPAIIYTDPTRLRQILFNLAGNAIKFTRTGTVLLRVGVEPVEGSGVLYFDVIDTGIGIPADQIESLFHPFTQADSSHTRKYGGSGLGLAISQQLAALLGGELAVASQPGSGTCVRLTLRLDAAKLGGPALSSRVSAVPVPGPTDPARAEGALPDTASAANAPSPPGAAAAPAAPRARVLLAEDTADSQMLISLLITELGYSVQTADNGCIAVDEALDAWHREEPYDVILMDIQMPELDGYAATTALRDAGYEGPIVAITAHAMGGSRERCLEAGCDDFLTKPIDHAQLADLFATYVGKRPQTT